MLFSYCVCYLVIGGQARCALVASSAASDGYKRLEFVTDFLSTEGIPILASDLCDVYARKVYFFPSNGNVFMKRIHELNNATIIERESQHRWELSRRAPTGSVDIFED